MGMIMLKAFIEAPKEGYDLHELHALMAPRPFLVSEDTLTEQTGGQR